MKKLLLLIAIVFAFIATSCTENYRAKHFGGTMKVKLPKGTKLVTVTWKEDNLWYLTRNMQPGEKPVTYTFHEESSIGAFKGTVILIEQK
jgi:hypothetical protein